MATLRPPTPPVAGGRLGDRLSAGGAWPFAGRETELARVVPILAGDSPRHVVFVHGPGGIGKSAFLREVARIARAQGRSSIELSAADALAGPGLAGLVRQISETNRPLVAIDDWDDGAVPPAALRDDVLTHLPAERSSSWPAAVLPTTGGGTGAGSS